MSLLTPDGQEVPVDPAKFRILRRGGFLFWNPERGLRQIKPTAYIWAETLRGPNPMRPATVRALDPSRQRVFRRPPTLGDELAAEYESKPAGERRRLLLLWRDDPGQP